MCFVVSFTQTETTGGGNDGSFDIKSLSEGIIGLFIPTEFEVPIIIK